MLNFLKKDKNIHEPLKKQIEDVKKLDPLIANEILNGLDCDKLPNSYGEFGSLTNPIPVNGFLGEIKYLGKLRGKSGHAVFFHRLRSGKCPINKSTVDIFEIVCLDGTQWGKLVLDPYHPRRSNLSPTGFSLISFNKKLKIDIPFGFGVNSFVENFPHGLPDLIDEFYGSKGVYSKRAIKWLNQYSFKREEKKVDKNKEEIKIDFKPRDKINNYSLIVGILHEAIDVEKRLITDYKDKLMNYTNPKLFDNSYKTKLFTERFIFLSSFLKYHKYEYNIIDMKNYVVDVASKEYEITHDEAFSYFIKREKLYVTELKMLEEFKHPHPGKILWCLDNPTCEEVDHNLNNRFEPNLVAGLYIIGEIKEVFKKHLMNEI